MAERKGGRPRPDQPGSGPRRAPTTPQVIRGAELEALKATHPDIRSSFALRWRDAEDRGHLGYNYRQATIGPNGKSRVLSYYDEPPTFESTYRSWHVGTAYERDRYGARPLGELYTLLPRRGELDRDALDRFLTEADEAGYDVARWFSGRRDEAGLRAVGQEGPPPGSDISPAKALRGQGRRLRPGLAPPFPAPNTSSLTIRRSSLYNSPALCQSRNRH